MIFAYVYTADNKKEDRIKKMVDYVKENNLKPTFAVNDIQGIGIVNSYGFKAMNVDAIIDLVNLSDGGDEFLLCTPEDSSYIKASFKDVKEICNE